MNGTERSVSVGLEKQNAIDANRPGFKQFQIHWNRYLNTHQGSYVAYFGKSDDETGEDKNTNLAHAILKAAWAALKGEN